ncbi:MAG: DUF429 domain-containing protein [Pseudobdellovibrionaceae bacterium]|nr:DUF429 domain-containing protein [Bdellovibrionales bacterium]USN48869.1 MAG: DUF429 domain-containing protein [Pseudobdellovibrionaceae bacterium]
MSEKQLSSSRRKASGSSTRVKKNSSKKKVSKKKAKKTVAGAKKAPLEMPTDRALKRHVFLGLCLTGGKTDRSCLAVVEYYPFQHKVFLARLVERIKSEGEISADLQLHYLINQFRSNLHSVAINAPLSAPLCLNCQLDCPGYENCEEPHIRWMWNHFRQQKSKRRKVQKLFTPYTERCAELHISSQLEEPFHPSHAMGANAAPVMARAQFIQRRISVPTLEVFPKLSLWRVGRSLGIQKSHLRYHKHSTHGEEAREAIVSRLIEKDIAFIYDQDVRAMIENGYAFDAFLSGITAVLQHLGQCEPRPADFPKQENWLSFPKEQIDWSFGSKSRKGVKGK